MTVNGMELDLEYLCTMIGNLSGIPVRIYEDRKLVFYHSLVSLPKDPICIYLSEILRVKKNLSYFATKEFHYYGIVNSGHTTIVVGPTRQIGESERELREIAFKADVREEDRDKFLSAMKAIVHMPIESVMQMLSTMNYVLNGEKISLESIAIEEAMQKEIREKEGQAHSDRFFSDEEKIAGDISHNTFDLENSIMSLIEKGDVSALEKWISSAPAVRGGMIAPDILRQRKNTFIVTVTLATRAAIRGGLGVDEAFSLSDSYIQRCELLSNPIEITNLQYHMILDLSERVECIRRGGNPSPLVLKVSGYVRSHIAEKIKVEDMADELFISRSYLSKVFHKESGETLSSFILREKTEEAKRLLSYSDKSLAAISLYLGFSSQSHFSRVFRSYVGLSPLEYRKKGS